jgi:hypothetical protein
MTQPVERFIEVMVPTAEAPKAIHASVPPLVDVRAKRVGFRIEAFPIEWTEDLLLRNFEIFMKRIAELLQIQYKPSRIVRFQRDEKNKAREPQVFDEFCRQIDWAILGIAG